MARDATDAPDRGVAESRTRRKKDAQEIEDLADELMALSAQDIRALPVQEEVKEIVREGLAISDQRARKRHRKYLAKNLRGPYADALDALRTHMADRHGSRQAEIQKEKFLTELRNRLLFPDTCEQALDELEQRFPNADLSFLREIVSKNLKREQRRYAREIYRLVVSIWERGTRQKRGDAS